MPVDLARLVGQRLVAPAVGDRAEQGDQRRRAGQHDAALGGVLDERGVGVEARGEERLGGEEQHHELRRLGQRAPVALGAQQLDVAAQLAGVAGQMGVAQVGVVGRRGVEEGVERHLGVDHDAAAAGQPHHQVGALGAVGEVDLLVEVAAVDQPGQLDGPAQVELAPAAAHLRPAQRGGQGLASRAAAPSAVWRMSRTCW